MGYRPAEAGLAAFGGHFDEMPAHPVRRVGTESTLSCEGHRRDAFAAVAGMSGFSSPGGGSERRGTSELRLDFREFGQGRWGEKT